MISRILVLVVAFVGLVFYAHEASARPKGGRHILSTPRQRMRQQAAAVAGQVQAAEQTKAAAQAEGSAQRIRAGDAANRLSSAKSSLDGANAESKIASEQRVEIENQILQEVGPDHPVHRARETYEQATEELKRGRAKALNSEGWKEEKLAAEQAGRSRDQINDLESHMLQRDSTYLTAKARHEQTASEYRRLRHELFSADPRWQDNVSAGRRLQADQSEASRNVTAQSRRQINAGARAKEADQTANAADGAIQQGQATLDQLQKRFHAYGGKRTLPGVSPSATPGKGSRSSK